MTTPIDDIRMPNGEPLKVMLILERSEDPTAGVGLVRHMVGKYTDKITPEMPAVGTWSTFDESGPIYVSLLNTIDAEHDFLIQYIRRQSDEIRARAASYGKVENIDWKPTRNKQVRMIRHVHDVSAWDTEDEDTHIFIDRTVTTMHGRTPAKQRDVVEEQPVAELVVVKADLDSMRARLLGRK